VLTTPEAVPDPVRINRQASTAAPPFTTATVPDTVEVAVPVRLRPATTVVFVRYDQKSPAVHEGRTIDAAPPEPEAARRDRRINVATARDATTRGGFEAG
jgi:hypothetical protein